MPARAGRTALYRHYAADGELLYIGISQDPEVRWEQHHWWKQGLSARQTLEWFELRSQALAAEAEAIAIERPAYNQQHNWQAVPFPCSHWPRLTDLPSGKSRRLSDLMREEIESGRWLPGQKLPRQDSLAAAVGLNVGCGIRATNILWTEGLITKPRGPMGFFVRDRKS
ncbi:GntR family transcriptional regulator [Streptomyces sp. NPDC047821]|uniref:GntR family transcriptional regulator n=1 Tax=Streptomyces sp. NPDC047821 TaxID=3365488 RepID=UPI0037224895